MSARYFEAAKHAALYAKYRPSPPPSIISTILDYLKVQIPSRGSLMDHAVDIGCGSGQNTDLLAPHFASVTGLDVSKAQVDQANTKNTLSNVTYKVSRAEILPFPPCSVQLVTACQACHWFNMPAFFAEVDRVLIPGGVVALYGYLFPRVVAHSKATQLTAMIDDVGAPGERGEEATGAVRDTPTPAHLGMAASRSQLQAWLAIYENKLSGCWGEDRKHVDNAYTDDRFKIPYADSVRTDSHSCSRRVSVADLRGYISSWSGYQTYCQKHGAEAGEALLEGFKDRLMAEVQASTAPEETLLDISFPYFLLMGRKPTTAK